MASALDQSYLVIHPPDELVNAGDMVVLRLAWTAAADGSFTTTALLTKNIKTVSGLRIERVVTIPGTPAPTASYSIRLNGPDGEDILAGVLYNRSDTLTEQAIMNTDFVPVQVPLSLSLAVSGNSVNGAKGTIVLYCSK